MKKSTKLYLLSTAALVLINLFSITLLLVTKFVLNADKSFDATFFNYAEIFVNKFLEFAIPPAVAVFVFVSRVELTGKSRALYALLLSLPRAVYLIPYYYAYYRGERYDTIESLVLSAIVTFFGIMILFLEILILITFLKAAIGFVIKKRLTSNMPKEYKSEAKKKFISLINEKIVKEVRIIPEKAQPFDFNSAVTVGVFTTVFLQFMIALLSEISTTVSFLTESSQSYGFDDVIYMIFSYIFILGELMIVHFICYNLKNFTLKVQSEDLKNEEKL